MIVDKPSGMLSHPNDSKREIANSAFYGEYDYQARCFRKSGHCTWLIHRLDQDTSGALLAAKNESTANSLREAFAAGRVTKRYLALVASAGGLKPQGTWLDHLATEQRRGSVRTVVKMQLRPNAELNYRLVDFNKEYRVSLLEIDLLTGKTHQIRVQAASRKHPLVGDDVYGDFSLNRQLRKELGAARLFLHAHELRFSHPHTKKKLTLKSALSNDWTAALEKLELQS